MMLVAPLLFISNIISSRYIDPLQDDVLWRDLLRLDINEEIEIFPSPMVKSKSDATDRPICSRPDCTALAKSRGLCIRHAYPCAIDGCEKQGVAGGYCETSKDHNPEAYKRLHSKLKRCKVEGCSKQVKAGGFCIEHAKEYNQYAYHRLRSSTSCKVDGCIKQAQAGGYCRVHAKEHNLDAYDRLCDNSSCKVEGCKKHAQVEGYCIAHSKQYDLDAYDKYRSTVSCKVEGCMINARINGYCAEHAQQYASDAYAKFRNHMNNSDSNRCKHDPHFKLGRRLRTRMCFEINRVGASYKGKLTLIGCSVDQLRQYFEYNHFQEEVNEWMNWENWGGGRCHINQTWEVDHIMPISSFDLTVEEEVKKCFHWSNLQPLEWQDNAGKSDSIPEDFEWCNTKEKWQWSEDSGKINYELPQA